MIDTVSYAGVFRAIGQALEGLGVDSFHLGIQDEDYVITGIGRAQPRKSFSRWFFQRNGSSAWLPGLRSRLSGKKKALSQPIELHYTARDIERLEDEGRARRQTQGRMPDAYSLPQLLRAIGGYMDYRGTRIIAVTKQQEDFVLEFEALDGQSQVERLPPSSIYGLYVRMYMRRKGRAQPLNRPGRG